MTYKEAQEKSLKVYWKTEPCHQEKCWCLMIVPKEPIIDKDGNEITIADGGMIGAEHAKYIVKLHNKAIQEQMLIEMMQADEKDGLYNQ